MTTMHTLFVDHEKIGRIINYLCDAYNLAVKQRDELGRWKRWRDTTYHRECDALAMWYFNGGHTMFLSKQFDKRDVVTFEV